jgi:hypothetical protein
VFPCEGDVELRDDSSRQESSYLVKTKATTAEQRRALWETAQRGNSLNYRQTCNMYNIARRTLDDWIAKGKLKKGTGRSLISADSIKANPPDFLASDMS